jgi:methionyl-tRNA formyltransferase
MRIVFMGTGEMACPTLEALAKHHEIGAVFTQPDRPKGRGLHPKPPPVKKIAEKLGLKIVQPAKIRDAEAVETLKNLRPDVIAVVAYGQVLPKNVLEIPRLGCVNTHASLLPKYRGAAPIQWAIARGERETGVTTMFMNEKMDEGDIILQSKTAIGDDETAPELEKKLAKMGAELMVETLSRIEKGDAPRIPQENSQASYAPKLKKEDGRIDWKLSADEIRNRVRAFQPWPSAFTHCGGTMLKLWRVEIVPNVSGNAGEILPDFSVATGKNALRIVEIQPEGGTRMSFEAFLRGHRVSAGAILR